MNQLFNQGATETSRKHNVNVWKSLSVREVLPMLLRRDDSHFIDDLLKNGKFLKQYNFMSYTQYNNAGSLGITRAHKNDLVVENTVNGMAATYLTTPMHEVEFSSAVAPRTVTTTYQYPLEGYTDDLFILGKSAVISSLHSLYQGSLGTASSSQINRDLQSTVANQGCSFSACNYHGSLSDIVMKNLVRLKIQGQVPPNCQYKYVRMPLPTEYVNSANTLNKVIEYLPSVADGKTVIIELLPEEFPYIKVLSHLLLMDNDCVTTPDNNLNNAAMAFAIESWRTSTVKVVFMTPQATALTVNAQAIAGAANVVAVAAAQVNYCEFIASPTYNRWYGNNTGNAVVGDPLVTFTTEELTMAMNILMKLFDEKDVWLNSYEQCINMVSYRRSDKSFGVPVNDASKLNNIFGQKGNLIRQNGSNLSSILRLARTRETSDDVRSFVNFVCGIGTSLEGMSIVADMMQVGMDIGRAQLGLDDLCLYPRNAAIHYLGNAQALGVVGASRSEVWENHCNPFESSGQSPCTLALMINEIMTIIFGGKMSFAFQYMTFGSNDTTAIGTLSPALQQPGRIGCVSHLSYFVGGFVSPQTAQLGGTEIGDAQALGHGQWIGTDTSQQSNGRSSSSMDENQQADIIGGPDCLAHSCMFRRLNGANLLDFKIIGTALGSNLQVFSDTYIANTESVYTNSGVNTNQVLPAALNWVCKNCDYQSDVGQILGTDLQLGVNGAASLDLYRYRQNRGMTPGLRYLRISADLELTVRMMNFNGSRKRRTIQNLGSSINSKIAEVSNTDKADT
jgi:hypothetical protein